MCYAGVRESVYRRSSNLRVCRFESDRRHHARVAQSVEAAGLNQAHVPVRVRRRAPRGTGSMGRAPDSKPGITGFESLVPRQQVRTGSSLAKRLPAKQFMVSSILTRCSTAGAGGRSATGLEYRRSARMGVRFLRPRPYSLESTGMWIPAGLEPRSPRRVAVRLGCSPPRSEGAAHSGQLALNPRVAQAESFDSAAFRQRSCNFI